jgi:hypothetical protein
MDRPVAPNMFGTPSPDPERIDPPGGFAHMPPSAPDPVEGSTAPMTGDVPPTRSEVPQAGAPQPEQSAAPSGAAMSTPGTIARFDPWNYRESADLGDGAAVVGYRVEATDGHIGKIDEASTTVGESYLVVDTGPWIFGKKVLLPAGTVTNIDNEDKRVYVDRSKAQIKDSPQFDPETFRGEAYRDKIGGYYSDTYSQGEMVAPPTPGGNVPPGPGVPTSPLSADTEGSGPAEPGDFPR